LIVKLANGIINCLPSIVQAAFEIIQAIWNVLKELPGKALQWGKDMLQGFINGIKSMLGNIGDAAKNVGSKIKEFLHFSRPDKGPLREYETWMPDMIKGLTKTLNASSPKLYNASKNLSEKIANGLDISNIYDKMSSAVNFETQRLSANLSTTANVNRNLNVSLNQTKSDVYLDGRKVGQIVTPYMSQTVKLGGV
jgi:phage-related protein